MKLRYGIIDENVLKRSVEDVILHERQRMASQTGKEGPCKSRKGRSAEKTRAGCAGTLAVIRSINSLAAEQVQGTVFSPVLLLPPETEEETLRELMIQVCRTAFSQGLTIQRVHAEVTDAVTRPIVCGTMSGERFRREQGTGRAGSEDDPERTGDPEGIENPGGPEKGDGPEVPGRVDDPGGSVRRDNPGGPEKGDGPGATDERDPGMEIQTAGIDGPYILTAGTAGMEILMAGTAGLEGTWILLKEHERELRERFPESFLFRMEKKKEELCILEAAKAAAAAGVSAMVSPSGGGFFAGLWDLSKKTGCGLEVDLQAVPILQETIEITEHFQIHPYWMRSAGCLLMAAPDAARVRQTFLKKGIPVTGIGRLLPGKKEKILRNGEETRYLDRPQTDSLDLFERKIRSGS